MMFCSYKHHTKDKMKNNGKKGLLKEIKEKLVYKNSLINIGIVTFILAIFSSIVKIYIYTFQKGKFHVFRICEEYIEYTSISQINQFIFEAGIAILFLGSNVLISYLIVHRERKVKWLIYFLESVVFLTICCMDINVNLVDIIQDIIRNSGALQFLYIILKTFFLVIGLNIGGITYGKLEIRKVKKQKKKAKNNAEDNKEKNVEENIENKCNMDDSTKNMSKIDQKIRTIFGCSCVLLILLIVYYYLTYYFGVYEANNTKSFRVLYEYCTDDFSNEYIFEIEGKTVLIEPIIFENEDIYIVSYLYESNNKRKIQFNKQKVICKQNVNTIYYSNIFEDKLVR